MNSRARGGVSRRARGRSLPRMDITKDPRWTALVNRDASADGSFFYSVATTGVYCRPSCGARTPRPENVAFHRRAADAERAGFRACKRCKPDGPPREAEQARVVAELCRLIETSEAAPTLAVLAERAGWSPFHLHRVFKEVTGLTPRAYAAAHRAKAVRARLAEAPSVTAAMHDAGYGSSSRFYERADAILGMTPRRFRSGGAGATIRFAVGECSLGSILVAASERGVCAIALGDDPEALTHDLEDRFPRAELAPGDAAFERLVAKVIGFVDGRTERFELPLDVRGTAFQERVWQALRAIPRGRTITYTELAARIGAPRAVRGVASACAANPVALAIPCHRVVAKDGSLAGYRWGIDRKRALLARERRRAG
ncbi:MAG: bifunctional DNA-binding transcriptional regulator/O6-methylguanine-DNA methyltransferase Ada [Labilithrix sp.]|nr:bifunctional DNA-binding transcriptional regulator/O6-methylguanine-DNA methyltransferase Ada [Labilithrix sp.]MCW5817209.1 bifunctional DNA-binding transcriptional regulator/O6-methylguanine-DNA methyltransferase Ada [Labilithrix sp.]